MPVPTPVKEQPDPASATAAGSPAGDDAVRAALRAKGLRATSARVLLLQALETIDHPTVESLHHAAAGDGIALTTVYRTLAPLVGAGLVWAVHVPGTGRTYHPGSDRPHAHLLCRVCGRLTDLEPLPPSTLAACGVPADVEVEHVQLTVIGSCAGGRHGPATAARGARDLRDADEPE